MTDIDLRLFLDILAIESTSGQECALADFVSGRFAAPDNRVRLFPAQAKAGDPVNVLIEWGEADIVLCTHLDTVPPYFAPTCETLEDGDIMIKGRGACDAKGQIIAMYTACQRLAAKGERGFGLLLLYGEETGSFGAKQYREMPGGEIVIVGEPTDNRMVRASKGTKAFEVTITGKSFHSGYPQYGVSAIDRFIDMVNTLRATDFPVDSELGDTTYNIGRLVSDNPQNILSDKLTCRVYFRTTFETDTLVGEVMSSLSGDDFKIKALGGDTPMRYLTLPGFETTTVSFGSDAPQLTNFIDKILCGPGSILVAHTDKENIRLSDIAKASKMYEAMYYDLKHRLKAGR